MYDHTGTVECRIVMCYVFKEYITDGASVYMWHEGSHSSGITGSEQSWNGGRQAKIMIPWGEIHKNICS